MSCLPMITILIPIYHGVEDYETCITSVITQDYDGFQIIVGVNGHLPDSKVYKDIVEISGRVCKDVTDIQILDLGHIKGKTPTLNRMIMYAKHDWVAVLHVTDYWLPGKLSCQLPYMHAYDIIGTKCRYFGDITGNSNIPVGDVSNFNFYKYNPIIISSYLIKIEDAYWEETIRGDYSLMIRLKEDNKKFFNVDKCMVMRKINKNTCSGISEYRSYMNKNSFR